MKKDYKTILGFPFPPFKEGYDGSALYFNFEKDFVEDNVRCIPMIVRFKLDTCGIKLKLSEWSKMQFKDRKILSAFVCLTNEDIRLYREYLQQVVIKSSGNNPTDFSVEKFPVWANHNEVPIIILEKLKNMNRTISLQQWELLSNLQRFALVKLSNPGHEDKNFPKAIKEFGLL